MDGRAESSENYHHHSKLYPINTRQFNWSIGRKISSSIAILWVNHNKLKSRPDERKIEWEINSKICLTDGQK